MQRPADCREPSSNGNAPISQLLHLWLREHQGKKGRKTILIIQKYFIAKLLILTVHTLKVQGGVTAHAHNVYDQITAVGGSITPDTALRTISQDPFDSCQTLSVN